MTALASPLDGGPLLDSLVILKFRYSSRVVNFGPPPRENVGGRLLLRLPL